jgi:hypothetical protein
MSEMIATFSPEQQATAPDHYDRVENELGLNPRRTDLNVNFVVNRAPKALQWSCKIRDTLAASGLTRLGLHPAPTESGLHVTGLLVEADIDSSDQQYQIRRQQFGTRLKSALQENNIEKIDLTLDWPEAEGDGVIASIQKNEEWESLMGLAADIAADIFPGFVRPENPGDSAHVTVVYGCERTEEQQEEIRQLLDELRASGECEDGITFTIDCVSLVDQISNPDIGFYIQSGPGGDAEDVALAG